MIVYSIKGPTTATEALRIDLRGLAPLDERGRMCPKKFRRKERNRKGKSR